MAKKNHEEKKPEEPSSRFTVVMPATLRAQLKAYCNAMGALLGGIKIDESDVARAAIVEYLEKYSAKRTMLDDD
jgi:hypothetical protein